MSSRSISSKFNGIAKVALIATIRVIGTCVVVTDGVLGFEDECGW